MAAWLTSPGHRANIEQTAFTPIGVGAASSAGFVRWTQDFSGRDGTPVLPPPAITTAPDVIVVAEDSGPIVGAFANDDAGGADPLSATFDVAAGPVGVPTAEDDRVRLQPPRDAHGDTADPVHGRRPPRTSSAGGVSITVTLVPDRPLARPDRARFSRRGYVVRVTVLANDQEADGEPLRVRVARVSAGLRATVRGGHLVITRRTLRVRRGLVRYRVTDPTGRSGTTSRVTSQS